jgi:hypothetical protein
MLAMLSAFRAKDRLLKSDLGRSCKSVSRRVSAARLVPTSDEIVRDFQADSSRTDSAVRILNAQPGSRLSGHVQREPIPTFASCLALQCGQ